ncbi:MAG: CocE/NonD family hydrolase [Chloroflexi bacterium]|nr:CocE/NonD family hydrolase [Chloroflexota bacterium]MYF82461.1 CocE/NonD family hydrolase [Chloroflexota bacterium]MYI03810.1 CocE/NonD family hydrolase [Chloroflexota bacterium]
MAVERVIVEKNIEIPMRDGIILRADLYRPEGADQPGGAVPGIVTRTPYDKEMSGAGVVAVMPSALKLAERGYAVVVCDCRGRYASEGDFKPFHQEGPDGYDTLEWVAAQSWCDGNTAIYGPSYVGATTMLATREQPPSLRCAIPIITADDYYDGWTYQGGAFQLGFVGLWGSGLAATGFLQQDHARPVEAQPEMTEAIMGNAFRLLGSRPLNAMPGISQEGVAPYWHEWLAHETRDEYWESVRHSADYSRFQVPMLHIGGWFDIFGIGTVRNFRGISAEGNPDQHLIMGPWAHTNYDRWLGEMEFGPTGAAVAANVIADINRFLDTHLKGREREVPGVRWFLMGANEWRTDESWPPLNAEEQSWYLGSDGGGNLQWGDGRLTTEPPDEDHRWDEYMYSGYKPVLSEGGSTLQQAIGLPGPRDQSRIESRDDVLCYTSEPLAEAVDVAGPVEADIWFSSDRPDTDITIKLVDVHPDGKAVSLVDGIMRARFREGFDREVYLTPGEVVKVTVDLASLGHRFDVGHRIRLEVSSSNYPRFMANSNDGGSVNAATEMQTAINRIRRGGEYPSALRMYVLQD